MKKCSTCKQVKSLEQFYEAKKGSGKYVYACKECEHKRALTRTEYGKQYRINKYKTDPEWRKQYVSRHEKDVVKDRCRQRTRYAVRVGKLKKLNCVTCDSSKTVPHHPDYNDHMNVIWFCQLHHRHYHLGYLKTYEYEEISL